VLVIGGAGYVGTELTEALLVNDFSVRVLDTFWYGEDFHRNLIGSKLEMVKGDMRNESIVAEAMAGVTDVIHLACISNDPSFDLDPKLGKSINLDSFLPIVNQAKKMGIARFIYASSSSVYGVKEEENVTEDLSLEPLTDYSRFKAECEDILLAEANTEMTSTVVRPATVCGVSKRQRLDLAVNILTMNAIINRKLTVFGGKQFRPNLHIKDMCRSYLHLLASPSEMIHKKIYNIGGRNLTLDEIALLVKDIVGNDVEILHEETNDNRSYRVDSSKITRELGFSPIYDVRDAISDLTEAFKDNKFQNPLSNPRYTNISRMKELNLG
jgi:nucleoside-diphosphate-sugar epimerase